MADAVQIVLAFALAAALTVAIVPTAISVANRTGFLDRPLGYKAHGQPTPYLGGAAVLAAVLFTALLLAGGLSRYWPLLAGTVGLALVGTVDDRVNLSPWLRVATELLAAWFLWDRGLGWSLFSSEAANLVLTGLWVTAIVNGFNLMDNLDGAAASVAAVSAACVAALAVVGDDLPLAVIAVALGGALVGFLRYNLAEPARIFLGDGGSMAIGFLLAGSLMVVPMGMLSGFSTLVTAIFAVGLPVFDTSLVILSRRRRGAPVLSGGTDHSTHRLRAVLETPRAVALALVAGQGALCGLAIAASRLGGGVAIALAAGALLLGVATIAAVDGLKWTIASHDS